jgi:hypothetical protein
MAKLFKSAFVALLAGFLSVTAMSAEYRWTKVGGDPCNPQAGCTLEWALDQAIKKASWPVEVKKEFVSARQRVEPEVFYVKRGWKGWMTWGQYHRKFRPDTVASWDAKQVEPADLWRVNHQGKAYHLIKVVKCGNWGGWVADAPAIPDTDTPQRRVAIPRDGPSGPPLMPLGVLPIVACPP